MLYLVEKVPFCLLEVMENLNATRFSHAKAIELLRNNNFVSAIKREAIADVVSRLVGAKVNTGNINLALAPTGIKDEILLQEGDEILVAITHPKSSECHWVYINTTSIYPRKKRSPQWGCAAPGGTAQRGVTNSNLTQ